jgi:hypothetical protein
MAPGAAGNSPDLRNDNFSWRSNPAFPLFAAGLAVAIPLAARFAWLLNHAERLDAPPQLTALFLCELPWLVSLAAIIWGGKQNRWLRSAGLAFGSGVSFCLVSIPLYFALGLTIWDSGNRRTSLVALEHFVPVCLVVALYVVVSGWLCGKGKRGAFLGNAAIGAGCFVIAFLLIIAASVPGSGAEKEKATYLQAPMHPDAHLRMVAACLIRHHFLHPEDGFPSSLAAISPDWNCDLAAAADPWAMPGYWVHYSAVDGSKDFRLEAIPVEGNIWQLVAGSDSRGEVFEFRGLNASSEENRRAKSRGRSPVQTNDAGTIYHVLQAARGQVQTYMGTNDSVVWSRGAWVVPNVDERHANAPPSLAGVLDDNQFRGACEDEEQDPKERRIAVQPPGPCYRLGYFPPTTTPPDTFAISITCVSYGVGCLRSYFFDYDGSVHATPEPRPATAQDPGLLPCESALVCNDPVWTASEQPSSWTFFRADLLSAIHSTNW